MMYFLIADDHLIIRQAIVRLMGEIYPQAVCEEVQDGVELIGKARERDWDMIISDISMPGVNGLEALKVIKMHTAHIPVLITSIYSEHRYIAKALESGASGFVPKALIEQELPGAVRAALAGKRYLNEALAAQLGIDL